MSKNSVNKTNSVNAEKSSDKLASAIDVNRLHLRLIILASDARKFEQAVVYLTRRGWQTATQSSIRDAFQSIEEFKPDFILLSVNYQSNKIGNLPTIFKNTFQTPVILFGERTDTLTLKLMQTLSADYKLNGQQSGPAIHRGIKNIISEMNETNRDFLEKISNRNRSQAAEQAQAEASAKKVKKGYTFTHDESSYQDRASQLAKSYEEYFEISNTNENQKPQYTISEDESDVAKNANYLAESELSEESKGTADIFKNLKLFEDTEGKVEIIAPDPSAPLSELESAPSFEISGVYKEKPQEENFSESSKEYEKKFFGAVSEAKEDSSEDSQTTIQALKSSYSVSKPAITESKSAYAKGSWIEELNIEDLLTKTVVAVTEESILKNETEEQYSLVLTLKDIEMRGYAVVSCRGPRDKAEKYFKKLEEELISTAKNECPRLKILDSAVVSNTEIAFDSKISGEVINKKFGTDDFGVVFKMIDGLKSHLDYTYIESDKKFKIHPKHLMSGAAQGANLYLHMPKNERYLLYLKHYAVLSEKQKAKLLDSDISVYIDEESFGSFKETFERNKTIELVKAKAIKKKAS